MKLRRLTLTNFRSYKNPTTVHFNDLTAIVGKNDIGKTTILEALDIFFEGGTCSLDFHDLCKDAGADKTVTIEVAFDDLPCELVLDESVKTTLQSEQLVDDAGQLVVRKSWDCSKSKLKAEVFAVAKHQVLEDGSSPLSLTNTRLKTACKSLKADTTNVNLSQNPPLRAALRTVLPAAQPNVLIPLDADDGKAVWSALEFHMPTFALFKSDRASKDSDSEVQDPLKFAIAQAMKEQEKALLQVQTEVLQQAQDVAKRTLDKLKEMDETLGAELKATFDSPKWDGVFKATLSTEKGIPLNKRGSGVRRLILLNFFRAEAERQAEKSGKPIIYAVEEPETSQHPNNQRMLVEAFKELAESGNVQVILTTHVPALAGLIRAEDLRLVRCENSQPVIVSGEAVYEDIADTLGVIPDKRLEVLVCVEGPHDVAHLTAYCEAFRASGVDVIDLAGDPRVAVIPLGGSTLKSWISQQYLRKLGAREYHIFDRDKVLPDGTYEYQPHCDSVNARGDGSSARLTVKRMFENYLHPDAVQAVFEVNVAIDDQCHVPGRVKEALQAAGKLGRKVEGNIKCRLASCASRMTIAQLQARGGEGEVRGWLIEITAMVTAANATPLVNAAAPQQD